MLSMKATWWRARSYERKRGVLWRLAWVLPLAPIYGLFVLGLFASATGWPYPARVSIDKAIEGARGVSWARMRVEWASEPLVLLFPFTTLLAMVVCEVVRPRLRTRRGAAWLSVVRLVAAVPMGCIGGAVLTPLLLLVLISPDGEFWAEGMGARAAMGFWFWYALAIGVRDVLNRRVELGRCEGCGYDVKGIDGRCPECGRGIQTAEFILGPVAEE